MNKKLIIALVLLIVSVCGLTYLLREPYYSRLTSNIPSDNQNIFEPVEIDDKQLQKFEPFKGFTLLKPINWRLSECGKFVSSKTPTYEPLNNAKPVFKGYINTPAQQECKFSSKVVTDDDFINTVLGGNHANGAVIQIRSVVRSENSSVIVSENTCQTRKMGNTNQEYLILGNNKVCKNWIFYEGLDVGESYDLATERMEYKIDIFFSEKTHQSARNYYISLIRTMIASAQLY